MYPRKAKSQFVGNLYDLHCLEYLLIILRGGGVLMFPMLVLHYSRSYASVYDIKENAHMRHWKSVDHV